MKTLKRDLEISNSKPTNQVYQPIPTDKLIQIIVLLTKKNT